MVTGVLKWLLWTRCVSLAVDHTELRGQYPDQQDIDDGMCVPIMCEVGLPPVQCTQLCALRHYLPVCQHDFCLCQRLERGVLTLVSPDEVQDQPPSPFQDSLNIFAFIVPLRDYFLKEEMTPSPEPYIVNVHEGRLFWLFHYILSGLFLLIVSLIIYELKSCRAHAYRDKCWEQMTP